MHSLKWRIVVLCPWPGDSSPHTQCIRVWPWEQYAYPTLVTRWANCYWARLLSLLHASDSGDLIEYVHRPPLHLPTARPTPTWCLRAESCYWKMPPLRRGLQYFHSCGAAKKGHFAWTKIFWWASLLWGIRAKWPRSMHSVKAEVHVTILWTSCAANSVCYLWNLILWKDRRKVPNVLDATRMHKTLL